MLAVKTKLEAHPYSLASSRVWELLIEPGQHDAVVVDAGTQMRQFVC